MANTDNDQKTGAVPMHKRIATGGEGNTLPKPPAAPTQTPQKF